MRSRLIVLILMAGSAGWVSAADSTTHAAPTIADIVAARVARLTRLLTLTTAQANQATSIFTTEETALAASETNEQAAQTALTTAVESNSTSGIAAAAAQLGSIETQEVLARATADAAFYAMLTPAQQAIDKELLAGGLNDFGPDHGPGHH